jgi:hypothetical protein
MKTKTGIEVFANFFIGSSLIKAKSLFNSLRGNTDVNDRDLLLLEFVETSAGIPVNLDVISCTLEELGENCKLITKELFKSVILEQSTVEK